MPERESPYCNCLYYSVNALSRQITRLAEEEFARIGLSPSHGFILLAVNKNPAMLSGELAKTLQLTPSTITRLIEKLENKDLIRREANGKFSLLFPTKKSLAMNEQLKQAWAATNQRYKGILGDTESKHLTEEVLKANRKIAEIDVRSEI